MNTSIEAGLSPTPDWMDRRNKLPKQLIRICGLIGLAVLMVACDGGEINPNQVPPFSGQSPVGTPAATSEVQSTPIPTKPARATPTPRPTRLPTSTPTSWPTLTPTPRPTAESQPPSLPQKENTDRPLAQGRILTPSSFSFLPLRQLPDGSWQLSYPTVIPSITPENSGSINIYGIVVKKEGTSNVPYFCLTPKDAGGNCQIIEARLVEIVAGDPVGELPPGYNALVGIRVNTVLELKLAAKLGIGFIRIANGLQTPEDGQRLSQMFREAKNIKNLRILFTYTPQQKFSKDEVLKNIEWVLNNYDVDYMEVSNEPDQAVAISPTRYAELFGYVQEVRDRLNSRTKLIVAALRSGNAASYFNALSAKRINPDAFAFHAYQDPSSIQEISQEYLDILKLYSNFTHPHLVNTEFGITDNPKHMSGHNYDPSQLIDALATAGRLKIPVAVHQFSLYQEGFGLYLPRTTATGYVDGFDYTPHAWVFRTWMKENPKPPLEWW